MFIMKFNVLEENQIKSLNLRLNFPPPYTYGCVKWETEYLCLMQMKKNTTQLYMNRRRAVMNTACVIIKTLIDWLRLYGELIIEFGCN